MLNVSYTIKDKIAVLPNSEDLAFNVALDTDCRTIDSYFIALQELTNSFLVSNDKIQVNNAKKFGSK